jgi:hypothetical protein
VSGLHNEQLQIAASSGRLDHVSMSSVGDFVALRLPDAGMRVVNPGLADGEGKVHGCQINPERGRVEWAPKVTTLFFSRRFIEESPVTSKAT